MSKHATHPIATSSPTESIDQGTAIRAYPTAAIRSLTDNWIVFDYIRQDDAIARFRRDLEARAARRTVTTALREREAGDFRLPS